MPFAPEPKARMAGDRARLPRDRRSAPDEPGSEWSALRALQLADFTTPLVIDDDERISAVVSAATGIAAATILGLLDSPEVTEAYERDREEARTAVGTPAELQGKTATTAQGAVRYTAPSLILGAANAASSPAACSRSRPTTC